MIADNESVMPRSKLWIDRDRQEWFFLFFLFLAREKKDTDKIILSRTTTFSSYGSKWLLEKEARRGKERGSSTSVRVDFPFAPIPLDFLNIHGRKLDRFRIFSLEERLVSLCSSAGS